MRKIIIIIAALMMISAPSHSQNQKEKKLSPKAQMKAEKKAQEQAAILKCITNKKIKIVISRIYPTESAALQNLSQKINKNTSDGYYVQLNGDLFSCYLPYIGTSRTAIMGQNLAIQAKDQKTEVTQQYDQKTESYLYNFFYKNDNIGDRWKCTIQLFTNGEANIRMDGNSRDAISYRGELIIPKEENKN